MFKWLYRRDNIDFITIMIKCLDGENVYRSYPTMDQAVGVGVEKITEVWNKNEPENSN
jgi:hypothetical protein